MKTSTFLSSLFISLIITPAFAQQKVKTDCQEMNLVGNVKSVRQISYKAVSKAGEVVKDKRVDGNFLWDKDFYMVFNQQGYKSERTNYKTDGSITKKLTYGYDDKGNVIEENLYNADGSSDAKHVFTYKYDDKGNAIERDWYNPDGTPSSKYIRTYDDKGNMTEETAYNAGGTIARKFVFKYDEKGNQIEMDICNADGSIDYKYTFLYDDKGNKIEENMYKSGGKFVVQIIRKYDEKGNITESNWFNEKGKANAKYTIKYEYDSTGNWTKQTQFMNGKPKYIVERTIEYF